MPVIVVIGAQWGDEGKGKITDYLAQKADLCIRVNGGDNAGHTVGEFKLHLVPCGIFNPKTLCIIGNGVAVNPGNLIQEMDYLEKHGVNCNNLRISAKAHLIMPWHTILDNLQEEERGEGKIGTTRRGIGPVFSDKVARFGFRMEDLILENMEQKLRKLRDRAAIILLKAYGYKSYDLIYESLLKYLLESRRRLSPLITETEPILWKALDKGKRILLEGAQGLMLDPDFGTYPNTTSSVCTTNGALQGSGVSWRDVTEVIGVVKTYTTRVCEKIHPFATEMPDGIANLLREQAQEYGATTGRARRIGWLDIPLLKYAARINGFTGLAVTRLDNLGTLSVVKICYAYGGDGRPKYKEMAGWSADIQDCRNFSDLPLNAKKYIKEIEKVAPVKYISVGPERDQMIVRG